MAHFPASLSLSRLAGSSDRQKVCRLTRSRNRLEAALGECSELSTVKADESLTKRAVPKVEVLYFVTGSSETSVLWTRSFRCATPLVVAAVCHMSRRCGVFVARQLRAAAGRQMVQLASAVLRSASLFPQRGSSITAWCALYGGRAADKVAPNGSVARTIVAAKPSLAQKPKKCTTHLYRASRRLLFSVEIVASWRPRVQPATFPVSVQLTRLQSPDSLVTTLQADTATGADSKDPARSASL